VGARERLRRRGEICPIVERMDSCPRNRRYPLSLLTALSLCGACTAEDELVDGLYTQAEWTKIQALSPLEEPPPDATNRYADRPEGRGARPEVLLREPTTPDR
jgi:hypothetical protein